MTRHNQGAGKKKITYKASLQGVERAEAAFKRYGFESKSNFAKSQLISRSTVTKFFQRQPIQLDSFKRICDALRLDWKEIAELEKIAKLREEKQLEPLKTLSKIPSIINQEVEVGMSRRQITVIDRETETVKAVITLEGNINSVTNFNILQSILREYSGDTIKINDIQEGSIKLTIEGSQEDIEKLQELIESGKLDELDGFPVESIQILGESSDESENNQAIDKWSLASQIVSKEIENRDLRGVDLSDTYLIGADLSGVDLSGADLSGAELSDTNLINLLEALAAAREIQDEEYRAKVLIPLADKLPELLTEALAAFREIQDEEYRAKILISLADKLPLELLTKVLTSAREIQYEYYRANVLISLADKLPELLTEALAAAREIKYEKYRANVLQVLVKKLLPHEASLNQVSQSFANLEGATLINVDLIKVDLRGGNLKKANFNNANLERAFLNNADLSQAKLIETNLIYTNLRESNLRKANLNNANLERAFLNRADLSQAKLIQTKLMYANLRDAKLVNATLIGANLANANLIGANLIDADLIGANVKNARFGHNQGISIDMKRNLKQRGAIFVDDPPREDSRVLVPV